MKRKILIILFIFGLSAMVFAQRPDRNQPRHSPGESVTITGTLVITRGMPALKSGDDTYLLGGISRLGGFIDGLKEGAQVTVEGAAITIRGDSKLKVLRPSKLTLNNKSYDLAVRPRGNFSPGREWGNKAPQRNNRNYNPGPGNRMPERQYHRQGPNFGKGR